MIHHHLKLIHQVSFDIHFFSQWYIKSSATSNKNDLLQYHSCSILSNQSYLSTEFSVWGFSFFISSFERNVLIKTGYFPCNGLTKCNLSLYLYKAKASLPISLDRNPLTLLRISWGSQSSFTIPSGASSAFILRKNINPPFSKPK